MRFITRNKILGASALLCLLPLALHAGGDPQPVSSPAMSLPLQLFDLADNCMACHNGMSSRAGIDISIGTDWRSSMMANAARDPYWQGSVRRESLDHPKAAAAIEAECSTCHMPMARYTAHASGGQGQVFANLPIGQSLAPLAALAADGVSCTLCHQITADRLGTRESMVGRFAIDEKTPWGQRRIFGPYDVDAGRVHLMNSASLFSPEEAAHIRESSFCASCHTLYTHSLGPDGQVLAEFPEQMPYQEWLHSSYPEKSSCLDCHMAKVEGQAQIASVWGQPREGVMQHVFRGGNFFMPRLLNAHRSELGVRAQPAELEATAERSERNLKDDTARLQLSAELEAGRLEARVRIHNLAGHKLPSAYPSRRVWVHFTVTDCEGKLLFESGKLEADGSIAGNDNDSDASRYEPHYELIERSDQVQIYEPILGNPAGAVTTGLLTATQYLKDNRLLPEGFDKTRAPADIAVAGKAISDGNFMAGGDELGYHIALPAGLPAVKLEAALYYQPIGYRWAQNLADYEADEPKRFVRYYNQAASRSALRITAAELRVESKPAAPEPAAPETAAPDQN